MGKGNHVMFYRISDTLGHLAENEELTRHFFAAALTPEEWQQQKETLGFPSYAGSEPERSRICKAEIYSSYIFGSFTAPDKDHVLFEAHKFIFYINERGIVFVDDKGVADKIIGAMVPKYKNRRMTPEFFLYGFLSEFLNDHIEILERYENTLFAMEENALNENVDNTMPRLLKIRRELTRLRYYYEQLEDMARELEGDEQNFFDTEKMQYMHLLGDRANRLAGMAQQSIDYCHTLRDIYHAEMEHKQDRNMQFLTILTSIFFPLTLITGWYGMNFRHMPELSTRFGYPVVILISICVIVGEIIYLKKSRR